MRKEERGTIIIETSLRLSLGFSDFGFLWTKQSRNPPLWQRQRQENSRCGNCGKTRSGVVRVIEVLEIVGVGRSASPAMQIKYRQRWAASFLDWCNWVSKLKVKVLSSNFVAVSMQRR